MESSLPLSKPETLDPVLHALADPTRRAVLARLAQGPASITELAEPFSMSLPAVSKHIRRLEKANLIERVVEGRHHRCFLRSEPLREVEAWLRSTRSFWESTLDSLASFVDEPSS